MAGKKAPRKKKAPSKKKVTTAVKQGIDPMMVAVKKATELVAHCRQHNISGDQVIGGVVIDPTAFSQVIQQKAFKAGMEHKKSELLSGMANVFGVQLE